MAPIRRSLSICLVALLFGLIPLQILRADDDSPKSAPDDKETTPADSGKKEKAPEAEPAAPRHHKHHDQDLGNHELTNEEKIRESLKAKITVKFVETPLKDALLFISSQKKLNIWLDEAKISDEGVATDTPATLSVEEVRLESVLNILLTPLKLDWVIQDEVLKITTQDAAASHLETHVYDIKSLLDLGYERDDLVDSIQSGVAPESWEVSGGEGTATSAASALVVRQTQRAHAKIERLLIHLEVAAETEATDEAEGEKALVLRAYRTGELDPEELMEVLPAILEPDSWVDNGGIGSIRAIKGALLVRQTRRAQARVKRIMADLAGEEESSEGEEHCAACRALKADAGNGGSEGKKEEPEVKHEKAMGRGMMGGGMF